MLKSFLRQSTRRVHLKVVKSDDLRRTVKSKENADNQSQPKSIASSLFNLPPLQRLLVVSWFSFLGLSGLWIIGDDSDPGVISSDTQSKETKSISGFIEWAFEMAKNDYEKKPNNSSSLGGS
ncbi:hypothetical protein MP638_007275 [Amoeboaphelidium occidentale]|nr:hypothetical protein MP638_007275 [Amoeboaphelidium occidentale]